MDATEAGVAELDWISAVLDARRHRLRPAAPVFWNPAPDSAAVHRRFLEHVLTHGGRAWRTDDTAVLVAAPRAGGWLVDDAAVPDAADWGGDVGRALWSACARDCPGDQVRFVCPVPDEGRADLARAAGLTWEESWWLLELDSSGGGEPDVRVDLPGADAVTVTAPPIYAPPGPILHLPAVTDPSRALPAAADRADELGCAAVVINCARGEDELAHHLARSAFRRHCDYWVGRIHPPAD